MSCCALLGASAAAENSVRPFWIYRDGSYAWPGDYSYVATVNYKDKQFLKVGDRPVRVAPGNDSQLSVDIAKYGPAPVAGVWATYTIPLDVVLNDAGTVLQSFYKFAIQSQSGITNDVYYVADVQIQ